MVTQPRALKNGRCSKPEIEPQRNCRCCTQRNSLKSGAGRPGRIPAGKRVDDLVELVDIVPTLYDLFGIEQPFWIQGRSLVPYFDENAVDARRFVRCESYDSIDYPDHTDATMYRDERWKFIIYHGKALHELYDLSSDPWEHRNLSADPDYAAKVEELLAASFEATVAPRVPQPPRVAPF